MKFRIFIINLILFLIAGILIIIFSGIGLLTSIYFIIFKRASTDYFRDVALELDILGNIICSHLFNITLIKKESVYLFGKTRVTISETLGRNQLTNTLTPLGNGLANILDFIETDHCIKSIRK